jgi:hypothetical protein
MTEYYPWARTAATGPGLRAADADRERTAERLRQSHADGRLDMAEFQHRLERCYQATTLGELAELVTDLPRQDERAERRSLLWLWPLRWRLAPFASILIALIVVSAATAHHLFWLWIPLVFIVWRTSWWRRTRWSAAARHGPHDWI